MEEFILGALASLIIAVLPLAISNMRLRVDLNQANGELTSSRKTAQMFIATSVREERDRQGDHAGL